MWRTRLVQELSDREEGYVRDGALIVGRPVAAVLSMIQGDLRPFDREPSHQFSGGLHLVRLILWVSHFPRDCSTKSTFSVVAPQGDCRV